MFYIGDMSRRQHYWLIYSIYCNTHIRTNVKLLNASFSHYLLHYKQRRTNWHIHKCKCIFLSVTEAPNMHCFTPYDLTLCWHNQIHPICRLWKTVMRDQPKHSNALLTSNVGCFQFMFSPPPLWIDPLHCHLIKTRSCVYLYDNTCLFFDQFSS